MVDRENVDEIHLVIPCSLFRPPPPNRYAIDMIDLPFSYVRMNAQPTSTSLYGIVHSLFVFANHTQIFVPR